MQDHTDLTGPLVPVASETPCPFPGEPRARFLWNPAPGSCGTPSPVPVEPRLRFLWDPVSGSCGTPSPVPVEPRVRFAIFFSVSEKTNPYRENQSLSGKPILIGKTNPYRENLFLIGKTNPLLNKQTTRDIMMAAFDLITSG